MRIGSRGEARLSESFYLQHFVFMVKLPCTKISSCASNLLPRQWFCNTECISGRVVGLPGSIPGQQQTALQLIVELMRLFSHTKKKKKTDVFAEFDAVKVSMASTGSLEALNEEDVGSSFGCSQFSSCRYKSQPLEILHI